MSNLAAMLRLPANPEIDTMADPCRTDFDPVDLVDDGAHFARIYRPVVYVQYCLVDHGVAGGDVYQLTLEFDAFRPFCCLLRCCVWHLTWLQPVSF